VIFIDREVELTVSGADDGRAQLLIEDEKLSAGQSRVLVEVSGRSAAETSIHSAVGDGLEVVINEGETRGGVDQRGEGSVDVAESAESKVIHHPASLVMCGQQLVSSEALVQEGEDLVGGEKVACPSGSMGLLHAAVDVSEERLCADICGGHDWMEGKTAVTMVYSDRG
jgi:hypothetical protein